MQEIAPSMFDTLGGQRGVGQSMFDSFKPTIGPSPDEMEAARQRVMFKKNVRVTAYSTRIFNLHDAKQKKAYEKLMCVLMQGVQVMTHKIFVNQFELLTTPKGQQWHRYVEWAEFELDVQATKPIGA